MVSHDQGNALIAMNPSAEAGDRRFGVQQRVAAFAQATSVVSAGCGQSDDPGTVDTPDFERSGSAFRGGLSTLAI